MQVLLFGDKWLLGSSKLLYALKLLFPKIEEELYLIQLSNQLCKYNYI